MLSSILFNANFVPVLTGNFFQFSFIFRLLSFMFLLFYVFFSSLSLQIDYEHEPRKPTAHISTMSNSKVCNSSKGRRLSDNLCAKIAHNWQFILMVGILMHAIDVCNGHGRLIEPPSRSSAFRYGFQTPPNYNDHELYCGGFARQQKNGGKCGECGDAWGKLNWIRFWMGVFWFWTAIKTLNVITDVPEPRPNEYGGKYGQGVIVRKYNPGSDMTLRVELTASHMG